MRMFKAFLTDRSGATAIEYGLIAALVSVAIISGFGLLADEVLEVFQLVVTTIENVG